MLTWRDRLERLQTAIGNSQTLASESLLQRDLRYLATAARLHFMGSSDRMTGHTSEVT